MQWILIHQAGGVAVMAHPGLNRTDEVIPGMVAAGLDGIGAYQHEDIRPAPSNIIFSLAERHHLLVTGGSDCHGMSKGRPLMGLLRFPYHRVERLKARARKKMRRGYLPCRGLKPGRRNFPWIIEASKPLL